MTKAENMQFLYNNSEGEKNVGLILLKGLLTTLHY